MPFHVEGPQQVRGYRQDKNEGLRGACVCMFGCWVTPRMVKKGAGCTSEKEMAESSSKKEGREREFPHHRGQGCRDCLGARLKKLVNRRGQTSQKQERSFLLLTMRYPLPGVSIPYNAPSTQEGTNGACS